MLQILSQLYKIQNNLELVLVINVFFQVSHQGLFLEISSQKQIGNFQIYKNQTKKNPLQNAIIIRVINN